MKRWKCRRKPKFSVGQVVAVDTHSIPTRYLKIVFRFVTHEGVGRGFRWKYRLGLPNWIDFTEQPERNLRALTKKERGEEARQ
jgi:hypothetical protein